MAEFSNPTFEAPARGNPLECRDEIWHQKTRIVGLLAGEEIITLAFFCFGTILACDRRTDGRTGRQTRCSREDPRVKTIAD